MYAPLGLDAQLAAVAARLAANEEAVLSRWRRGVRADGQLTAPDSLSRAQFVDHIPEILRGLHDALTSGRASAVAAANEKAEAGGSHGRHRWQQGYGLIELMREWIHLHNALLDELRLLTEEQPGLDIRVVNTAYRAIAALCLEGMSESAVQFETMQRSEAAGELRDLGRTLEAARDVERRQAEILRSAAHDLRGNMGIISNATSALTLDVLPKEQRVELFSMAQRAITAHTRLLSDLMDLARLQAGHERRRIERCNVSQVLRELCELTEPVARERGLALECDGPAELDVEADATKVGRILQNVLLNALHYTDRGGVSVRWGPADRDGAMRWWLLVADTGPGIRSGAQAVADALEAATQEARRVEKGGATSGAVLSDAVEPRHGEGIGLSIVKRLAQLLDATIEVESRAGAGTTVRVEFPRRYATD
jgi:signal transduction histidine kinase